MGDSDCPICLIEISDQKVGMPNHCNHRFCLTCLKIWTNENKICPLCRMNYSAVFELNENLEIEYIHINNIQYSINDDTAYFNESSEEFIEESSTDSSNVHSEDVTSSRSSE